MFEIFDRVTADAHQLNVARRVPSSANLGEQIACEWELANLDFRDVAVGFYLRSTPALIAALGCPAGTARCGRFLEVQRS